MNNQMHLEHKLDRRKQSFYRHSCTETLVDWWLSMICYIMITEIHDVHLFCIKIVSIVAGVLNFFLVKTTIRESVISTVRFEIDSILFTFLSSCILLYFVLSYVQNVWVYQSIKKYEQLQGANIYHAEMSANLYIL